MSRGPEILRLARKLGVELHLEGNRIHWRAMGEIHPVVAMSIAAHRADVLAELERLEAEEQAIIDACETRERLAQEAARSRIAIGVARPADAYLAPGKPLAVAERLAAAAVDSHVARTERND